MKSLKPTAEYRQLREQPLWRLLAADKAPEVLALLQVLLLDNEKVLPSSVIHERLTRELNQLRAVGADMAQTAQAYLAQWLAAGWVTRRFPAGAAEEEYELTADTTSAIRYVSSLRQPRTAATESRLATVMHQLNRLAEDTDTNPASRLAALHAERDRLDREIAAVSTGSFKTLPAERALERAREIIGLAEELTGDFRRVRADFERLNHGLREKLIESDGSRGDVLESVFSGLDLINDSEAGRTFNAFWRLLTDPAQSATLEAALSAVIERPFAAALTSQERRFLFRLTKRMLDEGRGVHDGVQAFAKSLKSFVQSREYLEHRRLNTLLKQAQSAALAAKDHVRLSKPLDYYLSLTSSRIRSAAQWSMYDPGLHVHDATMVDGELSTLTPELVSELVQQSEIDFRILRANLRAVLALQSQATVGQVLAKYPATQGLGSVMGYLALGTKHGQPTSDYETISWTGGDGVSRRAQVQTVYFLQERCHELVD